MNDETILSAASVVVRSAGIIETEVDGEIVMLKVDSGDCCGLNAVGSRVWKIIARPSRVADVCAQLVSEYDVDQMTCESQVLQLLNEMRSDRLIETVSEPGV